MMNNSNPDVPANIFVMTGMPRSGTTYLSAVLYNPPEVVTISEALGQWKEFYFTHGKSTKVFEIFSEYRQKLLRGEDIHTLEGTPGFEGKQRIDTWNQKKRIQKIDVRPDFVLGMKNPEVFLALLSVFQEAGVKCVITARHPLYVINSWVKKGQKRLKAGRSIENTFANGDGLVYRSHLKTPEQRRIDLFNHLAHIIIDHLQNPNVMLIRYEDWFSDEKQLDKISRFLQIPHAGYLRPEPILPEPLIISQEEQEEILKGCTSAKEFGYPGTGTRLKSITI